MTNRFGIYLHIPFCVHKCSYCDFYSFTHYQSDQFEGFVDRLCADIVAKRKFLASKPEFATSPVSSLFFGGGTPSLLAPNLLQRLINCVTENFELSPDVEITTEANPETLDLAYVERLKQTSINRVSLGAQSFNPENLKKLERLGSRESIYRAFELLKGVGFENINLDLIFAIPGQNVSDMLSDLKEVICLGPTHISSYNLTLKPAHTLYHALPEDDFVADLYETALKFLEENGFPQYEISNFSKPGKVCKHNLLYWSGGDFLGLGPSAASRFFWDGVFSHRKEVSDYNKYMDSNVSKGVSFESTTHAQTILEATFLELRQNRGISLKEFKEKYRFDPSQSKSYSLFIKEGFLDREGDILKLTPKGRLLADTVTERLAHS